MKEQGMQSAYLKARLVIPPGRQALQCSPHSRAKTQSFDGSFSLGLWLTQHLTTPTTPYTPSPYTM
ncbi:hypothetical protein E2C01_005803 [Portunus trituberculatus]|uniref:Uncharacterized protein n=1 Tax=Portunus trituberculatus TaxID=210409 RepID=A0A5B7D043_PORTR|nr:hypothetical protein [Portunus trituberculatus]